uniref:Tyrosinase copper-binding domain-containing protein n=1 Tax=Trichogramma kaykai TaxID=54128 RepID=A0ABD2XC80_9HYME
MANVDYLELLKLAFERPEESVAKLLLGSETINRATYTYPPISLNSDKDAAFRLKLESLDLHKLVQDAREEIYYAQDVGRHEVFSTFSAAHRRVVTKLVERFLGKLQNRQRARGRRLGDPRPSEQLAAELCAGGGLRPSPRLRELAAPETRRALSPQVLAEFETRPSRRAGQQHGKTRRKLFELLSSWHFSMSFGLTSKGSLFALQYLEVDSNATASSSDEENRVAYWREDVDINTHYWHLSLLYPDVENAALFGKKDRQGEFFWYIHHQIIARYNAERLSNGLARVKPVKDFRQPIAEGYFSKLDATAYGRSYPGRPANLSLARIDRPREKLNLDVSDLELYRARILEVVHRHEAYNELDEQLIRKFDPENGVNLLGNILFYAKDNSYYGNLRGSLLHALAAIHDPESRHGEELGPLADRATAMRDPAFYRVHALADELVLAYKDSLPAYSDEELRFDDVVCVGSRKGSLLKGTERHRERQIETRWSSSELDLSRGVSHAPKGSKIVASVHHLEHEDYELELQVLSVRSMATMATMRLFAAPSYDERRRRLTYDEQRKLMIELDKWVVKLDPGTNEIRRSSRLSSLTIPAENGAAADADGTPDVCQNTMEPCIYDSHDYCGSGWPRHSLLPKGNEAGFVMDFFVMITDYQLDEVLDENRCDYCSRAGMRFCARPKALYPDARPMGFPFDRRADEAHGIEYLDAFVSRYPNMWSEQITIKFANSQDV